MDFIDLAWQLPAIFTAVPMVARLLPFKLPPRAIPLLYFMVALLCMLLPCRVDLALGAAGLVSMIHVRLGESLANIEAPDMQAVADTLALGWDYIATHLLPLLSYVGKQKTIVYGEDEDDNPDDDIGDDDNPDYQEPPNPPEQRITPRIEHL